MIARIMMGMTLTIALAMTGCVKVEGGFKYEYAGRVLRADGTAPVKGVSVRLARVDAPGQPATVDKSDKLAKASLKYNDHAVKRKTDGAGQYVGILETSHGW